MLKEYPAAQHPGEPKRRWFADDFFDVFIWQDHSAEIIKFQLCYDIQRNERALTWTPGAGFCHNVIDDGEGTPTKNQSPILLADGLLQIHDVLEKFEANSRDIDRQISSFIIETLRTY